MQCMYIGCTDYTIQTQGINEVRQWQYCNMYVHGPNNVYVVCEVNYNVVGCNTCHKDKVFTLKHAFMCVNLKLKVL